MPAVLLKDVKLRWFLALVCLVCYGFRSGWDLNLLGGSEKLDSAQLEAQPSASGVLDAPFTVAAHGRRVDGNASQEPVAASGVAERSPAATPAYFLKQRSCTGQVQIFQRADFNGQRQGGSNGSSPSRGLVDIATNCAQLIRQSPRGCDACCIKETNSPVSTVCAKSCAGKSAWEAMFSVGDYNRSAVAAGGAVDNDASSLKVPTCCKVVLYQHGDFNIGDHGWSESFTSGDHASINIAHNDGMSSLRVMDDPSCDAKPPINLQAEASADYKLKGTRPIPETFIVGEQSPLAVALPELVLPV